jgi:hypothetical protein
MRKALSVTFLFMAGCATYTSNPGAFVVADQTQTLVQAFAGPNQVSGGIITGQNYYRNIDSTIQNPWNGFFSLRNLWLH